VSLVKSKSKPPGKMPNLVALLNELEDATLLRCRCQRAKGR
jgi:hypothetical protein